MVGDELVIETTDNRLVRYCVTDHQILWFGRRRFTGPGRSVALHRDGGVRMSQRAESGEGRAMC